MKDVFLLLVSFSLGIFLGCREGKGVVLMAFLGFLWLLNVGVSFSRLDSLLVAYFWVLAFVDLAVWSMLAILAGCHIFGSMVMNIFFCLKDKRCSFKTFVPKR